MAVDSRGERNARPLYPAYVVLIGMLVSILAVLDRQVLALLVEPLKADLKISDLQFSALTGTAFSVSYALAGLPIGAWVDRFSRVRILAGGLFAWSLATFVSSFARSFGALFTARMCVGIGESVLQPATKSLIADLFHGRHLAKAIAAVALGASIGSGLALILGGAIFAVVGETGFVHVPLIGACRPWQFVLLCMGLPGILLAPVVLFTVAEPMRRRILVTREGGDAATSYAALWRFTLEHRAAVLSVLFGYALYSLAFQGLIAWAPTYLIRRFGMTAAAVGGTLGPAQLAINIAMMVASGWWIDRAVARGHADAAIRWSIGAIAVGFVPLLLFPYMPSALLSMALLVVGIIGTSGYVVGSIPLMQMMPSQLRGKAMVTYLLLSNMIAGVFGPSLVALLTEHVFGDPKMVGVSLSIVTGGSLALTALVLVAGLGGYRASMAALDGQTR